MIRFYIFLFFVIILFHSCVTNYGVAHRSYPSTKLAIPHSEASDTSAFYVGAAYSSGNQYYWQGSVNRRPFFWQPPEYMLDGFEDGHSSYSLSTHYGYQSNSLYFGAGIIGYSGAYELQSFPIEEIQGDLDFWGAGVTTEMGLSFQLGDFRLRPIGIKLTGIYEGGAYADFKHNFLDTVIGSISYENENSDNTLINVSGVLGLSYHPGNWTYSFDVIAGVSDEDLSMGISSYITYKRVSLLLNCTTEQLFGRYSLTGGLVYSF